MAFFKKCDFCENKDTLKNKELCSECETNMAWNAGEAIKWKKKKDSLTVIGSKKCSKCGKYTKIFQGQNAIKIHCEHCEPSDHVAEIKPNFYYNMLGQRVEEQEPGVAEPKTKEPLTSNKNWIHLLFTIIRRQEQTWSIQRQSSPTLCNILELMRGYCFLDSISLVY